MKRKEINYAMFGLCVIGIIANITTILNFKLALLPKIPLVLAILSFSTALKYYGGGYKKDAAIHYYKYLNSLTNMHLASTTVSAIQTSGVVSGLIVFAGILQYGSILLLVESRDLGRKKSMHYATLAAIFAIVTFVVNVYIGSGIFKVISNIGFMLLGFMVYVMTYAKYEDKKERNRNLEIHADQDILAKKKK